MSQYTLGDFEPVEEPDVLHCPFCGQGCNGPRGLKQHCSRTHDRSPFTEEDFVRAARRVFNSMDSEITIREFESRSIFSIKDVYRHFDSWNTLLNAAGLPINESHSSSGEHDWCSGPDQKERAISDLQCYYESEGSPPTRRGFDNWPGVNYTSEPIRRRLFDSWNDALQEAGLGINAGAVGNRAGENNPRWLGGYTQAYGSDWEEKRQKVIERDNYRCRSCGMAQEQHKQRHSQSLEVHHIVPIREFDDPADANSLDNLVTACKHCHTKYEGLPVFPE